MKLMSERRYKKELSDMVGILSEQERRGEPLSYRKIDCAVKICMEDGKIFRTCLLKL